MSFVEQVRHQKVSSPVHKSFDLKKWENEYSSHKSGANCDALFKSGIIIYGILSTLRNEHSKIIQWNDRATHIRYLIGMANRDDRIISLRIHNDFQSSPDQLLFNELEEYKIKLAHGENKPDEISQFMAESLTKSISSLLTTTIPLSAETNKIVELKSIFLDNSICGLYHWIEKIWEDCLWNGYEFQKAESHNYLISQTSDDSILASIIQSATEYRRSIIILHKSSILGSFWNQDLAPSIKAGLIPIKVVSQIQKIGRKRHFKLSATGSAPNSDALLAGFLAKDMVNLEYYAELLNENPKELKGSSVNQLINVWLVLRSLSKAASNRFQGDAVNSPAALLSFAPTYSFQEVSRLVMQCTNIEMQTVTNLIGFLTFSGKSNQSQYSQPIIDLGDGTLTLSSSATHQANPVYVLERWLAQLSINISKKGSPFERHVRKELVNSEASPIIEKHFQVLKKELKFSPGVKGERTEEIDLVFILGNTLFLGEIKCNITPTEPTDFYNNRQIIVGAVEQIVRKKICVEKHVATFKKVLTKHGLNMPDNFKVEPLVIVNNIINSGFPVDGVPIIDLLILTSYLSGKLVDRARSDSNGNLTEEHVIRYYDTLISAENNFVNYLCSPPQLRHIKSKPRLARVPIDFFDESFPVTQYAAIESNVSLDEILELQNKEAQVEK
jgi:hypothetical protein